MRILLTLLLSMFFTTQLSGVPVITSVNPQFGPSSGNNSVTILAQVFQALQR